MTADTALLEFIPALPKAELHLHLEGSVDARTLSELSARHSTPLTTTNERYRDLEDSSRVLSEDDVRALYAYTDFTGFLLAFKVVTERLGTPEDYELITYRLCRKLAAEGVRHAEVTVSAGVILWRRQEFAPLFEGMERGRTRGERDFGVTLCWILDAVRQFGAESAREVVELAVSLEAPSVVGFGIGGDERRAGPELFTEVFAEARAHGLHLTCHAGETTGPESIRGALDLLKAERIGHALTLVEDAALLDRCVREEVPLEICLSSNLRTGGCADLKTHPLRQYFDAGAVVTLNTDDPEMFQTSLCREYQLAHDALGFSREELRQVAANSIRASWMPAERKRALLAEAYL